jgi:energy-coupling factor transport system ATP-binding protein
LADLLKTKELLHDRSNIVCVQNLSFRYATDDHPALEDISLTIPAGQLVLIMGAGGAGKSTLVNAFNGLIPHFLKGTLSGSVWVAGVHPGQIGVSAMAGIVGLVFQDFEAQLFSTRVDLELAFGMENSGLDRREMHERVRRISAAVGLEGMESREPAGLSGGQKQRLAIGAVLAANPQVLCLDEPTTDLDPTGKAEVFALLRQLRVAPDRCSDLGAETIVVIEHETEEASCADRIILLDNGRIVADGPSSAILADVALFKRLGLMPFPFCDYFHRLGVGRDSLPLSLAAAEDLFRRENLCVDREAFQRLMAEDAARAQAYGDAMIQTHGLRFSFEDQEVLKGIELCIREREFVAILGANGSGKTTLVKHFNGLLRPQQGEIRLAGADSRNLSICEMGHIVGYVFQNPDQQIFCDTVYEEVAYALKLRGFGEKEMRMRVQEALAAVGLSGCDSDDPFSLTKGQRQRVALASVLAIKPSVLVLDEPTTGLDYKDQRRMMELIRELNQAGNTIVMITHTMWVVAEYAHRVLLLREGRLIADAGTRAIFADEELLVQAEVRPPQIAQLANRLGVSVLSVEELLACTGRGTGR